MKRRPVRRAASFSHVEQFNPDKTSKESRIIYENKQIGDRREKKEQAEKQMWIDFQKQIIYHDDVTDQFKSIKDVLKKRVQFNKEARERRDAIKKKISRAEYEAYEPKIISLKRSQKDAMKEKAGMQNLNENAKKEGKQLTMSEKYDESMLKVKDSRSFYVHGRFCKYSKTSLGLLDNRSKIRWYIVYLITNKKFENFILLMIIVNSVFLGVKDYTDVDN